MNSLLNRNFALAIISLAILSFLYFFKLSTSFNYDSDFGRDIVAIQSITKGDITLLGPKTSFGGIYTGPYYYYFFVPIIDLFARQPINMVYFNALVFLIAFALILYFSHKNNSLTPQFILSLAWLFSTPLFIYSSRNPGNAFSYIPLLAALLIFLPWLLKQNHLILWLIYSFLCGLVLNTHVANVLIFIPLAIILFINLVLIPKRFSNLKYIFTFCMGILISLTPNILFEFTHDFVQLKNTFIDKSYQSFLSNSVIPNSLPTSSNPIINFWLLINNAKIWSGIPFILLFLISLIFLYISKKQKSTSAAKIILILNLSCWLLIALVAKSQMTFFYLYPFIILTLSTFVLLSQKIPTFIFPILILINLFQTPKDIYHQSSRQIDDFNKFTIQFLESSISSPLSEGNYNLYLARDVAMAPQGWEYRYFLNLYKHQALPVDQFNNAKYLLIIQENSNHDNVDTLSSWEIDQFGPKELIDYSRIQDRDVYLFAKSD